MIPKKLFIVVLYLNVLSVVNSFAQQYNFRIYGLEDGLIQSQITAICQDDDGNMWFGTFGGGLSKFNGQTFANYNSTDGLINNDINIIMKDKKGNLWFGTREGITKLYLNDRSRCLTDTNNNVLCIENFSTVEGLPHNYIYSIFEDSKNNFWIGTKNGVSRLSFIDNKTVFLNFNKNNGLADSIIFDIKEDKYGNIWFATSSGLSRLLKDYEEKLKKDTTDSFFLKAGSRDPAFKKEESTTLFENLTIDENKSTNKIRKLLIDNDGNIWCGTYKGLVVVIPKDHDSLIIFDDTISSFLKAGSRDPAFKKEETTYKIIKFPGDEGLADIYTWGIVESNKAIWIASFEQGVYRVTLDEEDKNILKAGSRDPAFKIKILDYFTTHNGLPVNEIWSIYEDREDNLWIGTSGGGVVKYRSKTFITFSSDDGLAHNVIWNILEDKNGNFWIRTHIGGVSIYNPKTQIDNFSLKSRDKNKLITAYSTKENLKHSVVRTIMKDSKDNIWVSTRSGGVYIATLNNKNKTLNGYNPFSKIDTLADKRSHIIFEDNTGAMWFATYTGLYRFYENTFTLISKEDWYLNINISAIIEDRENNIWIATRSGVSKLTPVKNKKDTSFIFKNYTIKEGLISNFMSDVVEDEAGNIWLGGEGGISVYDPKVDTFYNFTTKNGLGSDLIYLINKDDDGYIWTGTNKGVDRISFNDKDKTITVKQYGKAEGFIGIETNGAASYKDKKGNLWFGTIKGVTKYNPKEDKKNTIEPLTHINSIRLFFENVDWKKFSDSIHPKTGFPVDLILPYNQNHLTFDFIGISLTVPEKVKYKWKLENFDKDWQPVSSNHEATYSYIPSGEYTFMVKACNNDGVWNKKFTTFSFKITPPFWQTLWFYFSCVISVLGIFFSYVKIKEKKLKKEKKILEEKVTERTKELSAANEVIEKKNKDISASINYAYRIQDAILPDEANLQKIFPDSFVLYKIKDIVSGDFPWLLQKGDDTYITAVDCTGHGVPGAMLSMIGHFLLTEIIDSKNIHQPGSILTHLHEGVNKTLNQEVNIESRDGMDVAFCKINMKKMVLEYAGAHRPLFHLTNGDLNEIKGDGLPIGGVQYARRGKEMIFTNHIIKIKKGDAVYFYSDGYVDQFGGPDEKKIMSKRVREVILENKDKPMVEIGKTFEKIFVDWMGDNKQTDDVIFIGIRF